MPLQSFCNTNTPHFSQYPQSEPRVNQPGFQPYCTVTCRTNLDKKEVDGGPHAVDSASCAKHSLPFFQGLLFPKNTRDHLQELHC